MSLPHVIIAFDAEGNDVDWDFLWGGEGEEDLNNYINEVYGQLWFGVYGKGAVSAAIYKLSELRSCFLLE
jgi:hypothetical protein